MRYPIALLALVASTFAAVPVFADAWDSAMARAAAAKEKALDAGDPASWEEALRLFQEADGIRSTRESKYELAVAAAWLKQDDLACEAYEAAIALDLAGPARAKADAFLAEQSARMARVTVQGPAGALVFIEGRKRGALPHGPFVVFAGGAHLRVESSSGSSTTLEPNAKPGESLSFDVTEALTPKKPVEKPAPVEPRAPEPRPIEPAPKSSVGPILMVSGGVLAVAGAVTWIYAAGRVTHYDDVVHGYCTSFDSSGYCDSIPADRKADLEAAQDASDKVRTFRAVRTVGIVALATGAVTAAFGAVLTFGGRSEKTVTLRPSAAALAGGGFFGIDGSF